MGIEDPPETGDRLPWGEPATEERQPWGGAVSADRQPWVRPVSEERLLWGEPVSAEQLAAAERGYARCGPAERLLWERLSVFEGAFDRDAVHAVCTSWTLPPTSILDVLDRLVPLALLPVDDLFAGEDDVPRYWMPHPMRAVGARRLTERGERPDLVLRHRRWCVKLARRAADWWQRGRQLDARDLALRELPDLAAAMDPTTAPLAGDDEAGTAVEIAVSLWFLWVVCGRAAEGRTRLRHALALLGGEPTARALWLAAFLELESGRPEEADPLLARAWAAAVRDGDDGALGLLAHLRGSTALYQGRTRAAADEFREALALMGQYPEFGPTRHACWAGIALALCRTDPEAAQEALDQADLDRESRWSWVGRDMDAEAWSYIARAELTAWDGDLERAAEHARWALREHLRMGSAAGAAGAAELLAQIRVSAGRRDEAAHLLGAVDLLRTSVFDGSYRPAEFCVATRARSERALRALLDVRELRRAYEEGARRGLFALAGEA
ncbi:tetratricopeptide repeat protein [Streptomyces sp. SJL17-1]|uniref:tetratricopeptide repeat protein n=1 Tax=Streptomyces sp. SJL17-1 TaxID=2967223 RepID=UPI0029675923|nr:tetratricopeptide repeat protein [Streptomyces sp. SJL17-1]